MSTIVLSEELNWRSHTLMVVDEGVAALKEICPDMRFPFTVITAVLVQPLISVPVTVYTVVELISIKADKQVVHESPVAGAHV
jgi:hypothetical protein